MHAEKKNELNEDEKNEIYFWHIKVQQTDGGGSDRIGPAIAVLAIQNN